MIKLLKTFNRGWMLYALGCLIFYVLVDQVELHLRTLDKLQSSADSLMTEYNLPNLDKLSLHRSIYYYKTLAKILPISSIEIHALGYIYYQLGEYKKAITYFHQAQKMGLDTFAVDFNLGMAYFALADYTDAKIYIEKSFKLLTLTDYFRKDLISPYTLFVSNMLGSDVDRNHQEINLVLWHHQKLLDLIEKISNKSITSQDWKEKSEWDSTILNNRIFYIIPASRRPSEK